MNASLLLEVFMKTHIANSTFWLTDPEAPAHLKAAYKNAASNKATRRAVELVVEALNELIKASAWHTELQKAVLESVNSGIDLVELLTARGAPFLAGIEAANAEALRYKGWCFARKLEVQPILSAATSELHENETIIKSLQSQIAGFSRARKEAQEKYKAAGLTQSQIDAIGVQPTPDDLSEWKIQLEAKMARQRQIERFIRSAPDYDTTLLSETATTPQASSDAPADMVN